MNDSQSVPVSDYLEKYKAYKVKLSAEKEKLDTKITDMSSDMLALSNQFRQYKRNNENVTYKWNHTSELRRFDELISSCEAKIKSLERSILPVQRKMRDRAVTKAEAFGETLPTKPLNEYHNPSTFPARNEIINLRAQIEQHQNDRAKCITEFKELSATNWNAKMMEVKSEHSSLNGQCEELRNQFKIITDKIRTTDEMIKLESLRELYTKYAEENGIEIDYDIDDDQYLPELIKECNTFHQNWLLEVGPTGEGYHAETRCWKQSWHGNYDSDDEECDGVWTADCHRCACGVKWYWCSDNFDPSNLNHLTIESECPYGYIDRC